MNCGLVRRFIDACVDGELDPTTAIELERHVSGCAPCQERLVFVRAVKAQVREHVSATQAPAYLRERIMTSLDQVERAPAHSPGVVRLLPMRKRYAIPLSVAVAALMVMTYTMAPQDGPSSRQAAVVPALEDVVRVHSAELPPDVKGGQPQQVLSYFRNKVHFPVRPAQFERRDARLVGARLSNVRNRGAAALYYDVGGRRLTVVVFEHSGRLDVGAHRARLMGQELFYQQVNGYVVPVRAQNGLTYAFTGDLDRQSLLQLAASARVQY